MKIDNRKDCVKWMDWVSLPAPVLSPWLSPTVKVESWEKVERKKRKNQVTFSPNTKRHARVFPHSKYPEFVEELRGTELKLELSSTDFLPSQRWTHILTAIQLHLNVEREKKRKPKCCYIFF